MADLRVRTRKICSFMSYRPTINLFVDFSHTDDMESQEANIKTLGGISLRDGYCFQATPSPTCRLRDFAWRG